MVTHRDETTSAERVAIVTGGSHGIGREIARRLARHGHPVVVVYRRQQRRAETAVEEILATEGTALTVRADVADEFDVERLFSETTAAFGGVDVVVHAAGRMLLGLVAEYDLDAFDALQRTNVRGTFVVNQRAALHLRNGGAIVNLSCSVAGLALPTYAAYAASKAAVEAITPVLARELRRRDITVNAVAPGLEPAPDAADVADLVAFLVGEAGRPITGQVIRGDGGIVRLHGRARTDEGLHGRDPRRPVRP
jgi:3-oxoacyl-[acyl-carrier protein] reductase